MRIKRLLELDRSIGRKPRSKNAEEASFGFFSEEAPGTGAVISFSEYEAFALLNGLRIMEHGWPQGFAVSIMRCVRLDLEREHARTIKPVSSLNSRAAAIAGASPSSTKPAGNSSVVRPRMGLN